MYKVSLNLSANLPFSRPNSNKVCVSGRIMFGFKSTLRLGFGLELGQESGSEVEKGVGTGIGKCMH